MDKLVAKNIFVFQLDSNGIPFHHPCLKSCAQHMTDELKKYIKSPIHRSNKWISTSLLDDPKEDALNYAGAEYWVHNLIGPVFFYDKLKNLPSDAIILEVGPHGVFRKIITETLDSATYLSLMRKDSNDTNLDNFMTSLAKLYELGISPSIEKLYPRVEFPVSRNTPSIGSLMKWDHSETLNIRLYPDHFNRSTAADMNVSVDLTIGQDLFYAGHCIDGNILFPATGYLMLAWRVYAATLARTWIDVPVVFEQVQFQRPIFLSDQTVSKIKVIYSRKSCKWNRHVVGVQN